MNKEKQTEIEEAILAQEDAIVNMHMWGNDNIYKMESRLAQVKVGSKEYTSMIRALTAFYLQLNQMLAAACLVMGYPLLQWNWPDSEPLTQMAKLYPGLETTPWYQRCLSLVMMAPKEPNHPWLSLAIHKEKILTSGTLNLSD